MSLEQEKIPKTCILCNYLYIEEGWGGTDVTPGYDWSCGCRKSHFYLTGNNCSQKEYAESLMKAETCIDFEPNEMLKKFQTK